MQEFQTSGKRRGKQQTPTKLQVIISQQISIIIVAITSNLHFLPVVTEHALHIKSLVPTKQQVTRSAEVTVRSAVMNTATKYLDFLLE